MPGLSRAGSPLPIQTPRKTSLALPDNLNPHALRTIQAMIPHRLFVNENQLHCIAWLGLKALRIRCDFWRALSEKLKLVTIFVHHWIWIIWRLHFGKRGVMTPNARAERCGRQGASELLTDVA